MGHKLTIEVPEEAFAALQAAAASARRMPEELAAETVTERFNEQPMRRRLEGREAREAILTVMRAVIWPNTHPGLPDLALRRFRPLAALSASHSMRSWRMN